MKRKTHLLFLLLLFDGLVLASHQFAEAFYFLRVGQVVVGNGAIAFPWEANEVNWLVDAYAADVGHAAQNPPCLPPCSLPLRAAASVIPTGDCV